MTDVLIRIETRHSGSAFNANSWETDTWGSLSSRPAFLHNKLQAIQGCTERSHLKKKNALKGGLCALCVLKCSPLSYTSNSSVYLYFNLIYELFDKAFLIISKYKIISLIFLLLNSKFIVLWLRHMVSIWKIKQEQYMGGLYHNFN